jgi:hypothetical protein
MLRLFVSFQTSVFIRTVRRHWNQFLIESAPCVFEHEYCVNDQELIHTFEDDKEKKRQSFSNQISFGEK